MITVQIETIRGKSAFFTLNNEEELDQILTEKGLQKGSLASGFTAWVGRGILLTATIVSLPHLSALDPNM